MSLSEAMRAAEAVAERRKLQHIQTLVSAAVHHEDRCRGWWLRWLWGQAEAEAREAARDADAEVTAQGDGIDMPLKAC